jgi:hypothetical protein
MPSPSSQEHWVRIWESKGGIWNVLTESEFKQFALEQLARNWAEGKVVSA